MLYVAFFFPLIFLLPQYLLFIRSSQSCGICVLFLTCNVINTEQIRWVVWFGLVFAESHHQSTPLFTVSVALVLILLNLILMHKYTLYFDIRGTARYLT